MNKQINEQKLNSVNGGLVFNASNISGSDPTKPWEVLDNKNGNVLGRFATEGEALANAASYGPNPYNTMETDWNSVVSLMSNFITIPARLFTAKIKN